MTIINTVNVTRTQSNRTLRIFALITLVAVLAVPARSQQMSRVDRGTALEMLNQVAQDVQKHYYDPSFHGLDWNAIIIAAREKIRAESSMNMALAHIAAALDALGDSHTFFYPPPRINRHDYGFRTGMVGDRCYITRVRPGSDAEAKGLRPGDEVQSLEGWHPNRDTYWKLDYRYSVLRPQSGLHLAVTNPEGLHRQVHVAARFEMFNRPEYMTLDGMDNATLADVRRSEDEAGLRHPRTAEVGHGLLIMRIPGFSFDAREVGSMIDKARKHSALIIDLRDNPGGAEASLKYLVGCVFDHDVNIADHIGRKQMKPVVAKSMGSSGFKGKLVVLVNSKSASASELFARLVQLQKRGLVVGDRTSGRVMAARHYSYKVGPDVFVPYGFSLTEADLVMSDGKSLEHSGVIPDEMVLPTARDMADGRDPALSQAAALAGVKLSPEDAGKILRNDWPGE